MPPALLRRAAACAPQVERQNKPEVEYNVHPELMLPPVRVAAAAAAPRRTPRRLNPASALRRAQSAPCAAAAPRARGAPCAPGMPARALTRAQSAVNPSRR
jgi:hypothetical protein